MWYKVFPFLPNCFPTTCNQLIEETRLSYWRYNQKSYLVQPISWEELFTGLYNWTAKVPIVHFYKEIYKFKYTRNASCSSACPSAQRFSIWVPGPSILWTRLLCTIQEPVIVFWLFDICFISFFPLLCVVGLISNYTAFFGGCNLGDNRCKFWCLYLVSVQYM